MASIGKERNNFKKAIKSKIADKSVPKKMWPTIESLKVELQKCRVTRYVKI